MIAKVILLFGILFLLGYLLSAYLYKTRGKQFRGSALHIKVLLWLPIFAVFMTGIYGPFLLRLAICLWVLVHMLRELVQRLAASHHRVLVHAYTCLTAAAFLHLLFFDIFQPDATLLLVTLGFASVLSDVAAFFIGNFYGRHHLPERFNAHKSWEGVAGQLIGAVIGVALIRICIDSDISWWLALPIGIGAALGDLANSYVKRKEGIKDWGASLPGHGGYLDRFASLSGSIVLTYYFVLFMRGF